MKLFSHLDRVLVQEESRSPYASKDFRVWPSEASAELFDQSKTRIVGKCHRATYLRLIGTPVSHPVDAVGARRFRLGRACEADVVQLSKLAGLFAAGGIRFRSKEVNLSSEIDFVLIDPQDPNIETTGAQGYVVENKSIYGYMAASNLKNGEPKTDAVNQACLYLIEVPTGAKLKELIRAQQAEIADLRAKMADLESQLAMASNEEVATITGHIDAIRQRLSFQRLEVNEANLAKLSDGPLKCKLAYESRDECQTWEFDVAIHKDPFDGLHYPSVDGNPWKKFTVESIYARFRDLRGYWEAARAEAARRLEIKGSPALPKEAEHAALVAYEALLAEEVRKLPVSYWPPAEYEWRYSREKVESLGAAGKLSKTFWNEYQMVKQGRNRKPRPLPEIGDWNCNYCNYKFQCIAQEYPERAEYARSQMEQTEEYAD